MKGTSTGTVKLFNHDKGYGFIQPDDTGTDVFVHVRGLIGTAALQKDDRVEFELEPQPDGRLRARNCRVITE